MMIEKALSAALEPVVDDLIRLEKRLEEIQLTPGPEGKPGADAVVDVTELAVKLYAQYGDKLKADPVDTDELLKSFLEAHRVELKGEPGEPGQDGKDAEVDISSLAEHIYKEYGDNLRGADAPELDPTRVAEILVKEYGDQLKGKDAEPVEVDVDDVVKALVDSPDFIADNHTYIAKQLAEFEERQLDEVRTILFS